MSRMDSVLRSLGQGLEMTRGSALARRRKKSTQRPAVYLGRVGRSHRVRLPSGEVKSVAQRHVITRGALVVGAPVTLTHGMLDSLHSPHVANG
ncbi:MAG: hypothetical protein AAGF75_14445 [Cyanobacteria bacterium P01_H01_bin.130]